jgi:hypothetical protein
LLSNATTEYYQLKVRLGNWILITNILKRQCIESKLYQPKVENGIPKILQGYTSYNRIQRIKMKFELKLSVFYFSSLCAQLQILHVLPVTVDSRDNITVAQSIKLITIDNSF